MKLTKIALYLIILPIIVVVVASSLFLALFDANDYKQDLVDYVKQSSGRSLVFNGDAELMLYPSFGMKLGGMTFSNAPSFGSVPMLSVDEVSISVDVKSVLMLEPKVSQLILSELHIDLQKNKQGVSNWDDLVPKKAEEGSPNQPIAEVDKNPKSKGGFDIAGAFEGININNAQLSWHDASTGQSFNLDDLDFTTGKITPTEAFPLSMHIVLHQEKELNATVNFETEVFFDVKKQTVSLKQLDLQLTASGSLIPVEKSDVALTANVNFDLEKQFLSVSQLVLKANTEGGVMQKIDVAVGGDLSMNLVTQILNIKQLSLDAQVDDASMPKGQLKTSIKAEQLKLALKQRQVDLSQLQLSLNNIQMLGELQVKDYAKPSVNFNLSAQGIDLDDLLGLNEPTQKPQKATDTSQNVSEDTEIALPIELLKKLELNGQLNIASLKAMNVKTQNIQLKVTAKGGLLQLKPMALELYDGSLSNQISLDVRTKQPKFKIKTQLNKVQIGDLLIDFMQLDKIRGAATVAIDVTTQGSWVSKLKSNLNGKIALRFEDGALKGLNLRYLSEVAKAKLSGSSAPTENIQETDFTELKLSGTIKQGVFYSNDLSLKSPLIRVGGEGQADLNENTVDYTVNAKIIGSLEGQSGEGLEASGLLIPVRIFGPFTAIKTDILLDNMLKQQVSEKLAKSKAALKVQQQKLAGQLAKQKAELKAQQQQKIEAKKQALQAKQDKLKAELKAKQAAEQKKLDDKKKAAEDKAKQKLEDKLKGLFN